MQYNRVFYCTVLYSTVQCSEVQYSTVQWSTVQYSTVQYSTVQYSTVQYSAVKYSTVQYSTVQYSTVPYSISWGPYFYSAVPPSTKLGNLLLVLILKELAAGHCPKPLESSYSLTSWFLNINFLSLYLNLCIPYYFIPSDIRFKFCL